MKNWKVLIAAGLLTLLVFMVIYLTSKSNPELTSTAPPTPTVTPTTIPPTPQPKAPLSESLTRLSINEQSESEQKGVVQFESFPISSEKQIYAMELNDLYIFLDFKTNDPSKLESLQSQIRVEPAQAAEKIQLSPPDSRNHSFRLDIIGVKSDFTVTVGDLTPIRLLKKANAKLTYNKATVNTNSTAFIFPGEPGLSSSLVVSDQEKQVTLEFEEPVRIDQARVKPTGTWLDSRHLVLPIGDNSEDLRFTFENIYSESGSRLAMESTFLRIKKIPKREWVDYETGNVLKGPERMGFYDHILYSPNKAQYIGLIYLSEPIADEHGGYYGVVLEREGHEPVIVEPFLHSRELLQHLPIHWMDEKTLVYEKFIHLYQYDIGSNTRKLLISSNYEGPWMNAIATDSYRNQVYAMQSRAEGDYPNVVFHIDRTTINENSISTIVEKNYTKTLEYLKYTMLKMVIYPVQNGVYWTKYAEGKVITLFERTDGKQWSTEGRVKTVRDGFVILEKMPVVDGRVDTSKPFTYSKWTPGESEVPVPQKEGYTLPYGDKLIIQHSDNDYDLYDPSTNRWSKGKFKGKAVYVPGQQDQTIYRRELN